MTVLDNEIKKTYGTLYREYYSIEKHERLLHIEDKVIFIYCIYRFHTNISL